jgi:hypothetical protein
VRVNDGVPVKPLPMLPPQPSTVQPDPTQVNTGPIITPDMTEQQINEQVLQDVLKTLGE